MIGILKTIKHEFTHYTNCQLIYNKVVMSIYTFTLPLDIFIYI